MEEITKEFTEILKIRQDLMMKFLGDEEFLRRYQWFRSFQQTNSLTQDYFIKHKLEEKFTNLMEKLMNSQVNIFVYGDFRRFFYHFASLFIPLNEKLFLMLEKLKKLKIPIVLSSGVFTNELELFCHTNFDLIFPFVFILLLYLNNNFVYLN